MLINSIRERFSSSSGRDLNISDEDKALLDEFPDRPIPLIEINDDDSFAVNEEALGNLRKIEARIAVVAVAGLYRTGKSSLLNWLMDKQSGFQVGPTVQRCTRGLWIWGRPKICAGADGAPVWCVVLDTEGIGGLEADSQYDARIFSLATLLCSTLVYNSLGSIDENAINSLSFIANLAQHIKIDGDAVGGGGGGADADAARFHEFFPRFAWVLRDFALDLVDEDGERLTPNEYLEKALAAQPGFDKATAERNRVRHMLTAFFVERQCCTLVRPLADEAQLQKVDDVPYRALRREFRRALEDFKAGLFTGMKPKALRGRALTGPMFAGLAAAYVEAINAGGVPVIASAWDGVSRQESQAAAADGARVLRERLAEKFGAAPERSGLPAAEAALDEAFEAAAEEARAAYGKRAVGAEAAAFRAELEEALAAERAELAAANAARSAAACEALLQRLFAEQGLHERVHGGGGGGGEEGGDQGLSVEALAAAFAALRAAFLRDPGLGPARHAALAAFLEARWPEAAAAVQRAEADRRAAEVRRCEEAAAAAAAARAAAEGEAAAARRRAEEAEQDLRAERADRAQLEARLEAQGVRLGKATSALAAAEISLEEAREEGAARADALRRRSAEHEEDDHKLASKNNGKAGGGDLNKDVEELEGVLRKKNEEILELQAQIDLAVQSKGCGGANSGCLLS